MHVTHGLWREAAYAVRSASFQRSRIGLCNHRLIELFQGNLTDERTEIFSCDLRIPLVGSSRHFLIYEFKPSLKKLANVDLAFNFTDVAEIVRDQSCTFGPRLLLSAFENSFL